MLDKYKLKIGLGLVAIVYVALFIYLIRPFNTAAMLNIGLLHAALVLALLAVYIGRKVSMLHAECDHLKKEKFTIQSRFDECTQSFNSIFDHTSDGVALLNLQLDFFKTNKKFCDILGYTPEKILTWNLDHIVSLSYFSSYKIGINQLMAGKSDSYQFKKKFIKKSGEVIWLYIVITLIRDSAKQPHYFVMYVHNLTSQKIAEDHLSYLTHHDPLTRLPNRHQFEEFVTHLLRGETHQQKFNLLLIDIDGFKNINNAIGYESGNLLLQAVAKRLKKLISRADLLARLTSDEFVFITVENVSTEGLCAFSEKILMEILKPITIKRRELCITASIGISMYPKDGFTVRKLMKHADIALHYAKEQGKNNYQFYSIEMSRKEKLKLNAHNILSHALISNKFYLRYQARFKANSRQMTSIEAFLCLKEDSRTRLTLKDMLFLTKGMGLSMPIMDWQLLHACEEFNRWRHAVPPTVTLTIPCEIEQIKHPGWIEKTLKNLQALGVPPQSLAFEINGLTAAHFDEQHDHSIFNILITLKEAGFCLILAGFAVDYLLLSPVDGDHLYFDKIKITSDWTRKLLVDEGFVKIAMAIILKAKKNGIKIIAENIDHEEQARLLMNIGCSEFQGDLFMAPQLPEQMTDYIESAKKPVETLTS